MFTRLVVVDASVFLPLLVLFDIVDGLFRSKFQEIKGKNTSLSVCLSLNSVSINSTQAIKRKASSPPHALSLFQVRKRIGMPRVLTSSFSQKFETPLRKCKSPFSKTFGADRKEEETSRHEEEKEKEEEEAQKTIPIAKGLL